MDTGKAVKELAVIRQLMERPVRYSTMSGASGILAGLSAIAGVLIDNSIYRHYDAVDSFFINICVWAGVFVVAFSGVVLLTRRREKQQNMPFWSPIKRRILMTILPPFIVGVGITFAITFRWYMGIGPNQWGLIPAIWMGFYGVAVWQIGGLSIPEVRGLGAAFILSAIPVAAFFQVNAPWIPPGTAPYWTLGITFGGYHIIYGAIVWIRHGG